MFPLSYGYTTGNLEEWVNKNCNFKYDIYWS